MTIQTCEDLQSRLDAHLLWQIQRLIGQCTPTGTVQIIDTGRPGRLDAPRYRLRVALPNDPP